MIWFLVVRVLIFGLFSVINFWLLYIVCISVVLFILVGFDISIFKLVLVFKVCSRCGLLRVSLSYLVSLVVCGWVFLSFLIWIFGFEMFICLVVDVFIVVGILVF